MWTTKEEGTDRPNKQELPREIDELLSKFPEIFNEPEDLPPRNRGEHNIHIKEGCKLVVVGPYRYAHSQKNEMGRMVKGLLRFSALNNRPARTPIDLGESFSQKSRRTRLTTGICKDNRQPNVLD